MSWEFAASAYELYQPFQYIGRGAQGNVVMATLRSTLDDYNRGANTLAALLRSLVAVKTLADGVTHDSTGATYTGRSSTENAVSQTLPSEGVHNEILVAQRILELQRTAHGQCRNFVRIKHVHLTSSFRPWTSWYSMDLVQGEILDCFSATDMPAWLMAHILIEIFNGLRWLHGAGLCHGDLHEANVMLAKSESVPRVFIIDLGSCRDLDKKAERDDCHSVFAIIRNIVERSPMWDQALGRIRENAPDEEKNKQRLLDVLDQKAGDDRKGAEQCTVQAVWEACGDLAESIRSGGDQALPTDITEALGGDFTGGRMLEELAAKGGIDVELFSE